MTASGPGVDHAGAGAGDGPVLTVVDGGVATVVINRPAQRNALSPAVTAGLRAAVARLDADPGVRVIVVTGAGDRAFCAGADLATVSGGAGYLDRHGERGQIAALFEDLWSLGKPTMARVRGFALGGGFGLALACDLVVAATDAVFGTPEAALGLWPFMVTVPLLRAMPAKRALELMLTGRRVDAGEGERIGFVTRLAAVDDLDATVGELASSLAAGSPTAIAMGRRSFYRAVDQSAADALAYLHAQLTILTGTEDAREGLAAFADKRPPRWTGR